MNKDVLFKTKYGRPVSLNESSILDMNIDDYLENVYDHHFHIRRNYVYLNEYYSGNIPENIINRFKVDPQIDYILENLNTHNTELFVRKFKETFSFLKTRIIDNTDDSIRTTHIDVLYYPIGKDSVTEFIKSDEFNNFIKFFGYELTHSSEYRDYIRLTFEPIYAISANDLVYNKCHGVLYHLTDSKNVDSILSNGIRSRERKGDDDKYDDSENGQTNIERKYPHRNYFLALYPYCNGYKTDKRVLYAANSYVNLEKVAVFRINVDRLNINFYQDSYAKSEDQDNNAVYSYTSIPKSCIKFIGYIEKGQP